MVAYSYSDGFPSARAPSLRQHFAPPRGSGGVFVRSQTQQTKLTQGDGHATLCTVISLATAEFEDIFSLYDLQPR